MFFETQDILRSDTEAKKIKELSVGVMRINMMTEETTAH